MPGLTDRLEHAISASCVTRTTSATATRRSSTSPGPCSSSLADLPEFPPRHRIGITDPGLILRPRKDGPLVWSWARWGLIPFGSNSKPLPFNNARSDKRSWPWNASSASAALPASGFWEPEKPGRTPGKAPWSYYSMKDGRPFFMAGLWSDAPDPATGEVADSYTVIITDANAVMRVHDRMPVILATDAARRWIEPGPLPAELLVPYPAEEMKAWRVGVEQR